MNKPLAALYGQDDPQNFPTLLLVVDGSQESWPVLMQRMTTYADAIALQELHRAQGESNSPEQHA